MKIKPERNLCIAGQYLPAETVVELPDALYKEATSNPFVTVIEEPAKKKASKPKGKSSDDPADEE